MKAIETRYKGYRFRSRLEARWAVFFDALGLRWEYEPEGFELGGGVRYLPDFKVEGIFVEVKPDVGGLAQFDKAMMLSRSGVTVLGLAGVPEKRIYPVFEHGHLSSDFLFATPACKYSPFYWCAGTCEGDFAFWGVGDDDSFDHDGQVARAIQKARSARFEFGEVPV